MADSIVGLQPPGTIGSLDPLKALTPDGAQYVSFAHFPYADVTRQARTFVACTDVAGVAPGTALTTTPPFTLYNPINSGVALVLVEARLVVVSGTLGAGFLALAGNPSLIQTPPATGTPLTARCTFMGYVTGKGLAYQGATVAATPTFYRPLFTLGAYVGTTARLDNLVDSINGMFQLLPGTSCNLQAVAGAGTTPMVILSMAWEERNV